MAGRLTIPNAVRAAVWARDRGRCAACGVDTRRMARVLEWVEQHARALGLDGWRAAQEVRAALGWAAAGRRPWELDHVVPVAEGGATGAGNLRTLCRPCHVAATRAAPPGPATRAKLERLGDGTAARARPLAGIDAKLERLARANAERLRSEETP